MDQPPIRVFETRDLAACWAETEQYPQSLLALEVTRENVERVALWLPALRRTFSRAGAVALLDRDALPAMWLLREAGAWHVASSPRDLGPLLRLARRHLAEALSAPPDLQQWMWSRLPWSGDGGARHRS